MTKLISVFLIFFGAISCRQNQLSVKTFDSITTHQLHFDSTKISVLPIDTNDRWFFTDVDPIRLTNTDLSIVDKLLNDCIHSHNSRQDSKKEFNEFIDLRKYKLQYVPFTNLKGEKKVYVNAFCNYNWNYDSTGWKKYLVLVRDGGSCFFHLTINLTQNKYEEFYINGNA